jgi:hypothetical protein
MQESKAQSKKLVQIPDTQEIDSKALRAVEAAKALSIGNREEYERAGHLLLGLKEIEKEIDRTFDPVIKAAYDAHRAAINARDKHREPIRQAERILKDKMAQFQKFEEKRIREEEERLRELARKQEEEERLRTAERLLEEGRPEEALILLDGKVETPPIVLPESGPPKLKGIVTRVVWKFRITDPSKVPCEYHTIDESKIRRIVSATQGKVEIPGVEVYMEKEIAASGLRSF